MGGGEDLGASLLQGSLDSLDRDLLPPIATHQLHLGPVGPGDGGEPVSKEAVADDHDAGPGGDGVDQGGLHRRSAAPRRHQDGGLLLPWLWTVAERAQQAELERLEVGGGGGAVVRHGRSGECGQHFPRDRGRSWDEQQRRLGGGRIK